MNFSFPLFPAIISSFGGDETLVTTKVAVMATVGNVAEAIGSPIIGCLADRFGRKLSLMIASLGAAGSAVTLGYAGNFATALAARAFLGFCGNTLSIAQAMATDLTTEAERPNAISKLMAGLGLGFTFGPALGGFLFSLVGVKLACLAGSTVSFMNCALIYFALEESVQKAEQEGRELDVEAPPVATSKEADSSQSIPRKVWVLFVAFFLFSPFIVILEGFGLMYLSTKYCRGNVDRATQIYSLAFACFGVSMFVVSFFCYGMISKHLGFNCTLVTGGILACGSLCLIALAPFSWGLAPFVIGMMLLAAGCQLCYPAVPNLIGKLVPQVSIGRAFGINNAANTLARIIAPMVFTPLFDWHSQSIWLICAGLILIFTLLTLAVSKSCTDGDVMPNAGRDVRRCQTAPAFPTIPTSEIPELMTARSMEH